MSHLEELNERQKEAVLHTDGPLLVLAGAGSGKTRVITHRMLHLIETGVAPQSILAITFTNKAAREMRERIERLTQTYAHTARATMDQQVLATTFHALGVRILREHHRVFGLKRHFVIYDRSDSTRAIKKALEYAGYTSKQFEPRRILSIIGRAKGDARTRTDFIETAETFPERVAGEVWEHYDRILKEEQALDFDDLLLKTLVLLQNHEPILEMYQERFRYLHVDEYQDTNKVQYEIARLLAGNTQNICVVGDVDQNIYSWRGADISNILKFEHHFKNATTILLEENYRSTQTIIGASNTVIEKNKERVPKSVYTSNSRGEPITLYAAYNEVDEAHFVATTAREYIENGADASGIAVLFRTNFQSRALEEAFLTHGIPYQVVGVRFFERREVKDVLSFLRLAMNPESIADRTRIINVPPRGIGKVTQMKIAEGNRDAITGATREKVKAFDTLMNDIAREARTRRLSETLKYIMKRTTLEDTFKNGGEEGLERLENLQELVTLATRYDAYEPEDAIEQLLSDAALQSDQDELKNTRDDTDSVKLMTIHAAKGLEFPYVFVTGLEEGLFPHEPMSSDRTDDEEERRLFYVALTRAEKKVFLTFTQMRTIFGSTRVNIPSSFLSDIDDVYLEHARVERATHERVIELD